MPEFTGRRDIRSYIRTIWRWKLLIVVFVVGTPAVAYFIESGKPKNYQSSSTVAFTAPSATSTSHCQVARSTRPEMSRQLPG